MSCTNLRQCLQLVEINEPTTKGINVEEFLPDEFGFFVAEADSNVATDPDLIHGYDESIHPSRQHMRPLDQR